MKTFYRANKIPLLVRAGEIWSRYYRDISVIYLQQPSSSHPPWDHPQTDPGVVRRNLIQIENGAGRLDGLIAKPSRSMQPACAVVWDRGGQKSGLNGLWRGWTGHLNNLAHTALGSGLIGGVFNLTITNEPVCPDEPHQPRME
jgi:hypothetical protein